MFMPHRKFILGIALKRFSETLNEGDGDSQRTNRAEGSALAPLHLLEWKGSKIPKTDIHRGTFARL